jgi:hypothetical protein
MAKSLDISQPAYFDIEANKSKLSTERLIQISKLLDVDLIELINFKDDQIFNNTFNDESKGFFNIKELFTESFNHERDIYKEIINDLKNEIKALKNQ